ncbi:MAG TPA: hypothetical protein PK205_19125 [Promineifilum sp.]|nr:hypothetical protein [Promineifilum sp.]
MKNGAEFCNLTDTTRPITNYELRITNYELRITSDEYGRDI